MTATEWAAWFGAVTGSGALLWDIYKWKTAGPKLRVRASAGWRLISEPPDSTTYINVEVSNVGSAATTLKELAFRPVPTWWQRVTRTASPRQYTVLNPLFARSLPLKLEAGERWSGFAVQDGKLDELLRCRRLHCLVYHSYSEEPVVSKVKMSEGDKKMAAAQVTTEDLGTGQHGGIRGRR